MISRLPLLAALLLLPPISLAARSEKSSRDGLEIVVEEKTDKKEVPHYWPFLISVKNTSGEERTLHGEIELGGRAREKDKCVIYMEIPAGGAGAEIVQCRGQRDLQSWKFRVENIWHFIPK